MTPAAAPSESHIIRATTVPGEPSGTPGEAHQLVARSLRGARARTGLSEGHVVAIMSERGVALTLPALRRAERTGVLDIALAVSLADVYGTTTDTLAGRRTFRRRAA